MRAADGDELLCLNFLGHAGSRPTADSPSSRCCHCCPPTPAHYSVLSTADPSFTAKKDRTSKIKTRVTPPTLNQAVSGTRNILPNMQGLQICLAIAGLACWDVADAYLMTGEDMHLTNVEATLALQDHRTGNERQINGRCTSWMRGEGWKLFEA